MSLIYVQHASCDHVQLLCASMLIFGLMTVARWVHYVLQLLVVLIILGWPRLYVHWATKCPMQHKRVMQWWGWSGKCNHKSINRTAMHNSCTTLLQYEVLENAVAFSGVAKEFRIYHRDVFSGW